MKKKQVLILLLTLFLGAGTTAAQQIAIKTNADSKVIGVQPEYRYWFNGRPMTREYIGVALLGTTYDMQFGRNVYDGDAVGVGLTAGYSLSLGKKLNIEFYGGFGVVGFWQKLYYKDDTYEDYFSDGSVKTNSHGYKLMPVKLGVSISYILK